MFSIVQYCQGFQSQEKMRMRIIEKIQKELERKEANETKKGKEKQNDMASNPEEKK